MAGQRPVGLEVKEKAGRSPLPPGTDHGRGGEGVVAAVDLNGVEPFGIACQAVVRALDPEGARLSPFRFRPGAGADADGAGGHGARSEDHHPEGKVDHGKNQAEDEGPEKAGDLEAGNDGAR
ncbi:hypothetical protein GMSM_08070 [Geomonas sp. Red276]